MVFRDVTDSVVFTIVSAQYIATQKSATWACLATRWWFVQLASDHPTSQPRWGPYPKGQTMEGGGGCQLRFPGNPCTHL